MGENARPLVPEAELEAFKHKARDVLAYAPDERLRQVVAFSLLTSLLFELRDTPGLGDTLRQLAPQVER